MQKDDIFRHGKFGFLITTARHVCRPTRRRRQLSMNAKHSTLTHFGCIVPLITITHCDLHYLTIRLRYELFKVLYRPTDCATRRPAMMLYHATSIPFRAAWNTVPRQLILEWSAVSHDPRHIFILFLRRAFISPENLDGDWHPINKRRPHYYSLLYTSGWKLVRGISAFNR